MFRYDSIGFQTVNNVEMELCDFLVKEVLENLDPIVVCKTVYKDTREKGLTGSQPDLTEDLVLVQRPEPTLPERHKISENSFKF